MIVGDGASSFDVSPDGLTYTFHIRDGLTWADGTPITSQDFADAIARSQDPCIFHGHPSPVETYLGGTTTDLLVGAREQAALPCPSGATELSSWPIEGSGKAVDAVDDHTLVLRLAEPAPHFTAALTYTTAEPVPENIVQSGGFTWSQQNLCAAPGIGSGPFTCVA
jgi:ABC-type oligopeptide transport system substrate-binding subunit